MEHVLKHIAFYVQQGKSEGFESCDRPIVRKRPIWVKIGDVLSYVTLKFDGWPWKTIGHLSFAVSSFVQHFIAIGEFKLELLPGNAQFGSNSTILRAVWPWNLTYQTSGNPPVLGPRPVKTVEDQWKPLLCRSSCPVKKNPVGSPSMGTVMLKKMRSC